MNALPLSAIDPAPEPASGPPLELADLYQRHARSVLRAAYRVVGNLSDAEDVVQTVFLRLARPSDGRSTLDPGRDAGPYLRRAAVNAALDLVRTRKRSKALALDTPESPEPAAPEAGPERRQASRETRQELRRALSELSERAAEIFALRYFEGLGNKEISRLLGLTQTAVAVNLHRTRARLREELGHLAGGLS